MASLGHNESITFVGDTQLLDIYGDKEQFTLSVIMLCVIHVWKHGELKFADKW